MMKTQKSNLAECLDQFLSGEEIPGEESVPQELLDAMAVLLRRNVDVPVFPADCRGPAALVVLALRAGFLPPS